MSPTSSRAWRKSSVGSGASSAFEGCPTRASGPLVTRIGRRYRRGDGAYDPCRHRRVGLGPLPAAATPSERPEIARQDSGAPRNVTSLPRESMREAARRRMRGRRASARFGLRLSLAESGVATDLHLPDLRALLQVIPGELPGVLRLELVIERLRIVIVHQYEALAGLELLVSVEDLAVSLHRDEPADIEQFGLG